MHRYDIIMQVPKDWTIGEYEDFIEDDFPIKDCNIEGSEYGKITVHSLTESDLLQIFKHMEEYSTDDCIVEFIWETGDIPIFQINRTVYQMMRGWDEFGKCHVLNEEELIQRIRNCAGIKDE